MENKDIKPLVNRFNRPHEFHFFLLKGSVQSLVPNITQTIESHFGYSFAEENRIDGYIVAAVALAEVIDHITNAQYVECSKAAILCKLLDMWAVPY